MACFKRVQHILYTNLANSRHSHRSRSCNSCKISTAPLSEAKGEATCTARSTGSSRLPISTFQLPRVDLLNYIRFRHVLPKEPEATEQMGTEQTDCVRKHCSQREIKHMISKPIKTPPNKPPKSKRLYVCRCNKYCKAHLSPPTPPSQ